jgi:hypothetical protein
MGGNVTREDFHPKDAILSSGGARFVHHCADAWRMLSHNHQVTGLRIPERIAHVPS